MIPMIPMIPMMSLWINPVNINHIRYMSVNIKSMEILIVPKYPDLLGSLGNVISERLEISKFDRI